MSILSRIYHASKTGTLLNVAQFVSAPSLPLFVKRAENDTAKSIGFLFSFQLCNYVASNHIVLSS